MPCPTWGSIVYGISIPQTPRSPHAQLLILPIFLTWLPYILLSVTWGLILPFASIWTPNFWFNCYCMDMMDPIILVMAKISSWNFHLGVEVWMVVGVLLLTNMDISPHAPSYSMISSSCGGSFIQYLGSSSWAFDLPLLFVDAISLLVLDLV